MNVYSGYGGLKAQSQFVEEALLLEQIGGRANRRRPTYRHFVEEGLLREIGDFFGGLNYAAAAQRLGRLTS